MIKVCYIYMEHNSQISFFLITAAFNKRYASIIYSQSLGTVTKCTGRTMMKFTLILNNVENNIFFKISHTHTLIFVSIHNVESEFLAGSYSSTNWSQPTGSDRVVGCGHKNIRHSVHCFGSGLHEWSDHMWTVV